MPGIFISYRREDSAGHAGRLFDRLREHFGKDRVFIDVAAIEPGVDFAEAIEKAVGSCAVLLVVIGREWSSCTDQSGRRRLDDPNDFVRLEIASALNRTVRVIPVLVEGAVMPATEVLPDDVKVLARRNAVELRDTRWDADVQDLTTQLDKILTEAPPLPAEPGPRSPQPSIPAPSHGEPTPQKPQPRRRSKPLVWLGVGVIALGFAVLAWSLWSRPTRGPKELVVPDVIGKTLDDARVVIGKARLTVGETTGKSVPGKAAGTVVGQTPEPGTRVDPETPVNLEFAAKFTVKVPDVVGRPFNEARGILEKMGLTARPTFRETDTAKAETVLDQKPAAGSILGEEETLVLLLVAKPRPSLVKAPQLIKRNRTEALALLEKAGLKPGRIEEVPTSKVSPGTVVRQSPDFKESVAPGASIDLWIAIAPPQPAKVPVPSVRGLSLKEADLALAKGKFKLGDPTYIETGKAAPGTVIEQKPAAGELVNFGTAVQLFVAREVKAGIKEDCDAFDPATTMVKQIGGRWQIVDGDHLLFDFGTSEAEARRTLNVIRHYRVNQSCVVGPLTYLLVSGRAPSGDFSEEACHSFNPKNLQVTEIGGRWTIAEGAKPRFDFGSNRAEAERALEIIRKYRFTFLCGRPGRSFSYLRR